MGEDKKKKNKRNNKNKSKQRKNSEDVADFEDTASQEQNYVTVPRESDHVEVSSDAAFQGLETLEVNAECRQIAEANGEPSTSLTDGEVRRLEAEKESWLQREKELEEEIKQFISEKRSWTLEKNDLEEKIMHLQKEKECFTLMEVNLKEKIEQLESEADSWRVKQVQELVGSRNDLLRENQQLMERMSSLELEIQHLKSKAFVSTVEEHARGENGPIRLEEAAQLLVEKLIVENAELVEKVSELCIEMDRRASKLPQLPVFGSDPLTTKNADDPHHLTEHGGEKPKFIEPAQCPAGIPNDRMVSVVIDSAELQSSTDTNMQRDAFPASVIPGNNTSEIEKVPLEENEIQEIEIRQDLEANDIGSIESQPPRVVANEAIPLSDAPLIGAPFRLISFVAGYVSGADLVRK